MANILDQTQSRNRLNLCLTFNHTRQRFFRSTLVQTLFYGVFSAWVLWNREAKKDRRRNGFDWRLSAHYLRVPILRKLFHEASEPGQLDQLNLSEALDWATDALNRVNREAFFASFNEGEAVQYFYEPFLEAFDPELRKELGVWYTPSEIVRYMVARVDTVLRQELDIADGLADKRVYVLDPCCGTGAYLVEVIRRIHETLKSRGDDALLADDLKHAVLERVFGFEILPAPFVVAHLQLGLLLQSLDAPLSEKKHERAGVYLTNALTGWEPPQGPKNRLLFAELEEERDAAEQVKQHKRILVVLGNPPYNGYAGMAVDEERELTNAYRTTKRAPVPEGQGLNDLYVRFFGMAERRIVELSREGVICFISNYSWLDGLSFTGMRERYLEEFDRIWIDCLNGDKYKTGKLTPEGEPDPSIFSTEWNREGIQVGTAIALLVRKHRHRITNDLRFRNLWGKNKRAELLESIQQSDKSLYDELTPLLALGLPLLPTRTNSDYANWALLPDLFPASFPGVKTSRDDVVIDIDRERLVKRMEMYFDPSISHEEMARIAPSAMEDSARFKAQDVRDTLRKRGFLPDNIVRYCYRPFDLRWLYWEPETNLLDRNRAEYFPNVTINNFWLAATQQNRKAFDPPQISMHLCSLHVIERGANLFSLRVRAAQSVGLFADAEPTSPEADGFRLNLSESAVQYLNRLGTLKDAEHLFYHVIAILHAPEYRKENAGALRQDWPRVPLPATKDALLASAALGRQIAALLDTETPVDGVTTGTIRNELKTIAVISRAGGGALNPDAGELELTAGWGHAGKGGITMPGKGKVIERAYTSEELAAINKDALECFGARTCDVWLNDLAYWRNVPTNVWDYTIGGYQVMKKWLSYRELELLRRSLKTDEVREVTNMARRIAALLLLAPQLDENYRKIKEATYQWP
jgi:predicted helicase